MDTVLYRAELIANEECALNWEILSVTLWFVDILYEPIWFIGIVLLLLQFIMATTF